MPGYAWPSYAAYPNYAALTYPKQYSPTAWPYIGPFYPYPQVPLGWRKVTLEWDDGWWFLDFKDSATKRNANLTVESTSNISSPGVATRLGFFDCYHVLSPNPPSRLQPARLSVFPHIRKNPQVQPSFTR